MTHNVIYKTEYGMFEAIESVSIDLSFKDRTNIELAQGIIKSNSFISSMRIDLDCAVLEYLDSNQESITEFIRTDVEQLIVYSNAVYFYAQSKYNNSDYLEAEINL